MAVVHLKSTPVTNADAGTTRNAPSVDGAALKCKVGKVTNSAADDIGATYRYVRVPSNARIHQLIFVSQASGATGQLDIGIYQTAENGGAVVDADFFASALDPGGGALNVDATHEATGAACNLPTRLEMPLWQALGLSADPQRDYDIAGTVTEVMADAVTHGVKVAYAI